MDECYRKAGKLDSTEFATFFNPVQSGLVGTIRACLLEGHDESKPIYAELYKLNVYGKFRLCGKSFYHAYNSSGEGSFFKLHKDNPRGEKMFGSLIVPFPTPHMGGELLLRHTEREWSFDSTSALQSLPEPSIAYIAFCNDVEHEVPPILSGHRVTLTYNLYFEDKAEYKSPPDTNSALESEAHLNITLSVLLGSPTFLPEGGSLGFGLVHHYPLSDSSSVQSFASFLKGSDAVTLNTRKDLGLATRLTMLYNYRKGGDLGD